MLRVGIVGVGTIARDYMGLIAAGRVNARLTALCSRNQKNMEQALAQTGLRAVQQYTDYHAMLEGGEIDVVMICTPHLQHPQLAIDALVRGIHPLVEKPLGVYAAEGAQLCAAAVAHPALTCGVLYCHRMNPAFREIKQMIEEGAIGALKRASWSVTNLFRTEAYHQSSSWRGRYASEGGGVLMNQASHQLDLFLWLCGQQPKTVHGFCYTGVERGIEVENDAHLHLTFADGATGQFTASSREFPGSNRLELIGDNGQLILEDSCRLRYTKLLVPEREFARTSEGFFGPVPHTVSCKEFAAVDNLQLQSDIINDFLAAVEGSGVAVCPPEQALHSLELINAAYLSAWEERTITLPLDQDRFAAALKARI